MLYKSHENIYIDDKNWISPSFIDGISIDQEIKLRRFGARCITEASIFLRLPANTSITAKIIF